MQRLIIQIVRDANPRLGRRRDLRFGLFEVPVIGAEPVKVSAEIESAGLRFSMTFYPATGMLDREIIFPKDGHIYREGGFTHVIQAGEFTFILRLERRLGDDGLNDQDNWDSDGVRKKHRRLPEPPESAFG